jgi:protoporphyrinogen oxidase
MGENHDIRERKSRIYLMKRFFDYPLKVSNAIFTMPPLTTVKILIDYLNAKIKNILSPTPDNNFENWVVNRFGWTLYDIYFRVYTEKTWGLPCTELNADWAAQRITLLSLWDTFVKTIWKRGDTPRTYVNRFHYPKEGGIGALSKAYERQIKEAGGRILSQAEVSKLKVIDEKISQVNHSKGESQIDDDGIVFSTLPITDLVATIDPKPPQAVLEAAKKLKFRSIVFVYLTFEKDSISDDHWIYLPERRFHANRISEANNFSIRNCPDGKTIVGAEITCQKEDDIWNSDLDDHARKALDGMCDAGLVNREQHIGSMTQKVEHAYPIYDLEYKENLKIITDYLNKIENLRYFGRNGLFRYNNMDHSVDMGLKAAKTTGQDGKDYMKIATEEKWFG